MLFETVKSDIAKSKGIKAGKEPMNLLLVRPFDVIYKGERHPVIMVKADSAGNRHYAIPQIDETETNVHEPLKWITERWIEEVVPLAPRD